MPASGAVTTRVQPDGLAVVTFGHPAHNALPSGLLGQLAEQLREAGENPAVKLLLLKSDGDRTFCAGASFDELLAIADEASGHAFFSGFAAVINAIRESPKLTIGRVQGKAVGGGVGLIAACDYAFATAQAAVKLSEIGINIGPFVIAPAIERKIGVSALTQLSLNPGSFFDAAWCHQRGLLHEVEPTIDAMDGAIQRFCASLLGKSPDALSALKRTLWRGTDHWATLLHEQAAISGRLALSPETKKLLMEFKQR